MEKISKLKKYIELSEKMVSLPDNIIITDVSIEKIIYLGEDTFLPVIATYANFISRLLLEEDVFPLVFKKNTNSLFYCKIFDNNNDFENYTSEAFKLLVLSVALEEIFPKNSKVLSSKNYYEELITKWRNVLDKIEENKTIDPILLIDKLIKESLYINLMEVKNKLQNKND